MSFRDRCPHLIDFPLAHYAGHAGSPVAAWDVPQHRLLTAHEWNRLRQGEIRRFTYWSELGPFGSTHRHHAEPHIVTRADCP